MNNPFKNFYDDILNAEISLNETEYLAFIIGKRVIVAKEGDKLPTNTLQDLITHLDIRIIQARAISMQALEKKKHIPIKNALGLFFHFDKDQAMVMFQSIIKEDFNDSLDRMKNMEHLVYLERFFNRLKLNYIPKLTSKPEDFIKESDTSKFIHRDFLRNSIDEYGMFSFTDSQFITRNNPYPINVKHLLDDKFISILQSFFSHYETRIDDDILIIFHDYLTSPYSKYKLYEINQARDKIDKIINTSNLKQEFKYLLTQEIPLRSPYINKTNFRKGIFHFFDNKKSYSMDSLKFYSRKENIKQEFSFLYDNKLVTEMKKL